MTATCDAIFCGRAATHRIAGRDYCDRHAQALAASVNARAGRRILRPAPLVAPSPTLA
jgi:hypothetical protein